MFCHIDHIVPKPPFFRANKNRLQLQSLGLNFNFQLSMAREKTENKALKETRVFQCFLPTPRALGGLECGPARAGPGWTNECALFICLEFENLQSGTLLN